MSEELRPCPYCGGEAQVNTWTMHGITESRCFCSNSDCPNAMSTVALEQWDTRPLEDALHARIAELEKDNDEFRQLIHDWIIILTPDDGYVPDSECNDVATPIDVALRKRIAELEGKIDQLTAHSDIERQDDKSKPEPNVCEACGGDGTVLLRDGYGGQVIATAKCTYCNGTGRVNKEREGNGN